MMNSYKNRTIGLLAALGLGVAPRMAEACAMCGLSPGDHGGHAFNTSVIFMLSAPYAIFGVLGGVVFLAWRTSRKHRIVSLKERN